MPESELLSSLIALIYDAALDPNLWPQALQSLTAFVGGSGANFFWHDLASESAGRFYSFGDDPSYRQLYFEKYAAMNPLFPATNFVETGVVVGMYDIVPRQEMTETRFYKEWIEPQKIVDSIGANLEKSSTSTSLVVVIRSEENGFVDAEARRRMGLVVPHMMRAVCIGQIVDRERQEKAALAETLGRVAAGIFMVDPRGKMVFANDSGNALLQNGTMLRDGQGVLTAVDPQADKALRDAFAASGGDAEIGVRGVAIPLSSTSRERWLAHVLPLTSGARREAGMAFSASAAVFVRKTGLDTPSALETLAKLYRLTGTEVRVLQGIVDIGGLPKVAKALGISEGTTKTHLKSLFAKTGTNRQVDLVKLVADAAGPFAG